MVATAPPAMPLDTVRVGLDTNTMLQATAPLALVPTAVRSQKHAVALLLVFDKIADESTTVGPAEYAFAMHTACLPTALILTTGDPIVPAKAFEVICLKLAVERAAVGPLE